MGAARGEGPRARCCQEEEERPHGLFTGAAMAFAVAVQRGSAAMAFAVAVQCCRQCVSPAVWAPTFGRSDATRQKYVTGTSSSQLLSPVARVRVDASPQRS